MTGQQQDLSVLLDFYASAEELLPVEVFGPEAQSDISNVADVQFKGFVTGGTSVYREPVLSLVAVLAAFPEHRVEAIEVPVEG